MEAAAHKDCHDAPFGEYALTQGPGLYTSVRRETVPVGKQAGGNYAEKWVDAAWCRGGNVFAGTCPQSPTSLQNALAS